MRKHPLIESNGIDHKALGIGVVLTIGLLITVPLLLAFLFPVERVSRKPGDFPEPTLRVQAEQLKAREEEQLERLQMYGWVDKAGGIVHIPLAQAEERLLKGDTP